MTSRFRATFSPARLRQRYGVAAVIHEMNDPKRNPIPRAERRKAERVGRKKSP